MTTPQPTGERTHCSRCHRPLPHNDAEALTCLTTQLAGEPVGHHRMMAMRERIAEELREFGIDDPHSPEGRALLGAGHDLVYPEQARRSAGRWITQGEVDVVMRRIDQLKSTIDLMTIHRVDTSDLQRAYDQVLRALTKTFGLRR